MPGVPKSKGCDACRKRKKKCDASDVGCTWCRDHGIPCEGFGKQRYMFKDEGSKLMQRYVGAHVSKCKQDAKPIPAPPCAQMAELLQVPSNELSSLTLAFISNISWSIDISHHLVGTFGAFLMEIPKRLGMNEALDAAADLLMTSYMRYCAGNRSADSEILVKNSRALRALGENLDNPVYAHSSETLCATMVMSICQVLLTASMPSMVSHSVGAAQILKGRGFCGPQNEFEQLLLLTLRYPVVIEALWDDRIQFTKEEWQSLVLVGLDNGSVDGDMILCLGQMPDLMRRGRAVVRQPGNSKIDREDLVSEVVPLRDSFQLILHRLRERWKNTIMETTAAGATSPANRRMWRCHFARSLAFGLAVGILINSVLGALQQDDEVFRSDSFQMSEEMLELAEFLTAYRPLGSMAITVHLAAARFGAKDSMLLSKIESRAEEFGEDIYGPGTPYMEKDLERIMGNFTLS